MTDRNLYKADGTQSFIFLLNGKNIKNTDQVRVYGEPLSSDNNKLCKQGESSGRTKNFCEIRAQYNPHRKRGNMFNTKLKAIQTFKPEGEKITKITYIRNVDSNCPQEIELPLPNYFKNNKIIPNGDMQRIKLEIPDLPDSQQENKPKCAPEFKLNRCEMRDSSKKQECMNKAENHIAGLKGSQSYMFKIKGKNISKNDKIRIYGEPLNDEDYKICKNKYKKYKMKTNIDLPDDYCKIRSQLSPYREIKGAWYTKLQSVYTQKGKTNGEKVNKITYIRDPNNSKCAKEIEIPLPEYFKKNNLKHNINTPKGMKSIELEIP